MVIQVGEIFGVDIDKTTAATTSVVAAGVTKAVGEALISWYKP
jgi:uncharacterized protein (DUF697 family)